MGESSIQLSVALVTRNRPDSLERTLKSLRAQDVQPYEVIVSDDSDAEHAAAVAALANKYQCCYLSGPKRGLYANRNHVATACGGTHIRTMDDDHEFPAGHFRHCYAAVQEDPTSVWVIGEFLSFASVTKAAPNCPGELHPRGFSVTPKDSQNCSAMADGSCIFPSAVFSRDSGYVESFKFGSSFLELGSRLSWLGYRIRFLEATFIVHHTEEFQKKGDTVWFAPSTTAVASRIFAMLCFSFIYQPLLVNKVLTCLQIAKDTLSNRKLMTNAILTAVPAFVQHKAFLKSKTAI